ncbi:MAG: HAMP domain-containing histidine kinase [Clostridia bacterium]|nr:HAMP domain-containing histidine kinase [Clostridia bacterium]
MFRKSRIKIVALIMASLVLFLALTLGVIYVSSRLSADAKNEQMLRRFVERGKEELTVVPDGDRNGEPRGGEPPEGEPPDGSPGRDRRGEPGDDLFGASAFYSVEFDAAGEVLSVDSGRNDSIDGDELVAAAREAAASGKETGRTGRFLFIVENRGDGTFVAFIDSSVTDDSLTTLLRYELIVGGAALVLIFLLSLFLSSRIIKPLEENDKRQKQFVSDAGHELKTPISVISANTEILSRGGDNEWLSNIRYETERMGSLVRDLLRLSRAENAERVSETVDLSRLVEGEELPFETVAFERGITIQAQIKEGVTVDGDPGQLKQLTAILIDNAIRHGTGEKIAISLVADHRSAILRVTNDGEEIPKEIRDRLFERFYRRDEARGEDDSFGLGLAIAKAIAEAHRGSIGVGCRDGKVEFTVTLPLSHGKK